MADERFHPDGNESEIEPQGENPWGGPEGRERERDSSCTEEGIGDESAAGVAGHGGGDDGRLTAAAAAAPAISQAELAGARPSAACSMRETMPAPVAAMDMASGK